MNIMIMMICKVIKGAAAADEDHSHDADINNYFDDDHDEDNNVENNISGYSVFDRDREESDTVGSACLDQRYCPRNHTFIIIHSYKFVQ